MGGRLASVILLILSLFWRPAFSDTGICMADSVFWLTICLPYRVCREIGRAGPVCEHSQSKMAVFCGFCMLRYILSAWTGSDCQRRTLSVRVLRVRHQTNLQSSCFFGALLCWSAVPQKMGDHRGALRLRGRWNRRQAHTDCLLRLQRPLQKVHSPSEH